MNISRILLGLLLIVGASSALATGTNAFFSDNETSTGNTFTAGAIDLQVDNESYYNGILNASTSWAVRNLTVERFFDFDDIKPNDYGEDTISLHVNTGDAYMCADVTLTSNEENGINGPEGDDGDTTDGPGEGELADNVQFLWWADDGDNVLEDDENVISQGPIGELPLDATTTVALADSDENIWTDGSGPITGDETFYIGKAWCFGAIGTAPIDQDDLTDAMSPAGDNNDNQTAGEPEDGGITCDGSLLDNTTQTDSLTADVTFRAVQARNNPSFQCVPDDEPEFGQCASPDIEAWADSVVMHDQGNRKNGTSILAARRDASRVLGPAETLGLPSDVVPPGSTFYSLGFNVGTSSTRSITVSFDNVILNGDGPDVRVYEVTGGVYPDESATVEASQDGITWVTLSPNAVRDEDLDLGSLAWAKFIRITDLTPTGPFEPEADGYDVDAVQALNCGIELN